MPLRSLDANDDTLHDPAGGRINDGDKAPALADMADVPTKSPPKIRSIDDLRRLNTRATQEGMYAGVLGGGVMTLLAKRIGVSKNGLVVTFILGSSGISYLISRRIIVRTLGEHYEERRAAAMPKAPDGSPLLHDPVAPALGPSPDDPRVKLARDLENIGKPKERTRWTKGRGLAGEVEEEAEMRDKYMRPGVPRV